LGGGRRSVVVSGNTEWVSVFWEVLTIARQSSPWKPNDKRLGKVMFKRFAPSIAFNTDNIAYSWTTRAYSAEGIHIKRMLIFQNN
jgi:hypothetical protein